MTVALLAVAVAVAVAAWPVPRPGARRLCELSVAARLAGGTTAASGQTWLRLVRSRSVVCLGALALSVLSTVWRGPVVGMAAGVAAALGLSSAARAARRRAARSRDRDLSAGLRLLGAELAIGSSAAAALAAAGSVAGAHRPAFAAAATATADGDDLVAAVTAVGAEPELIAIARAWQVATTLGLPLAAALARVDDDVQSRREQARVVAAVLAGPRASAALLSALPVLGVGLGLVMGARPLHVLLDTAAGRLLLCLGVVLDAAGVVWTAWLISAAERL
jgi:tight adherence protein B